MLRTALAALIPLLWAGAAQARDYTAKEQAETLEQLSMFDGANARWLARSA
jgi:hypothetical protein